MMLIAGEQRNVDVPAEVAVFESDVVGFAEKIGVKNHRVIGSIGNANCPGS